MDNAVDKKNYSDRFKVNCSHVIDTFGAGEGAWQESEADIEAGLAWGAEKARLLKWVRMQMRRRLTKSQRRAIELYYFEDLTYAEIGRRLGCAPSTACRAVQRGVKRLREAARVDPPAHLKRGRPSIKRRNRVK